MVGQQVAAFEISCGFGADFDDDFADLVAVEDAVGLADFFAQGFVAGEGVIGYAEFVNLFEAEGFLFAVVQADEVPNAVFVDHVVRLDVIGFAFCAADFAVGEGNGVAVGDGGGEAVKFALLGADVFVLEAFDHDALVELFLKETAVNFGKQALDAGKVCDTLDFFEVEVTLFVFVDAVVAWAGFAVNQAAEAFAEVTLDGTQAGLVVVFKLVDVESLAAVEADDNINQTDGEAFVLFGLHP